MINEKQTITNKQRKAFFKNKKKIRRQTREKEKRMQKGGQRKIEINDKTDKKKKEMMK